MVYCLMLHILGQDGENAETKLSLITKYDSLADSIKQILSQVTSIEGNKRFHLIESACQKLPRLSSLVGTGYTFARPDQDEYSNEDRLERKQRQAGRPQAIDSTGMSRKESDDSSPKSAKECSVCLSNSATHAFLPCGHLCICEACSKTVVILL